MDKLIIPFLGLCVLACGNDTGPDEAPAVDSAVEDAPAVDALAVDAAELGLACEALGGTCVPGRWAHCPVGTQPTDDVHSDCAPGEGFRGYFCCVPAPPSSCSDNKSTNCFADECHACWGPAQPALTCREGRVCCGYVCLD